MIADDEPITRLDIKEMLEERGYKSIVEASDGHEAVQLSRIYKPELVLMDIKMPNLNGIEAASILGERLECCIIFLTAYSDLSLVQEAKRIRNVVGYLVKPVREEDLFPAVEVGLSCYRKILSLEKEKNELKEALETRKLVERAKGILMKKYGWDEDVAYRKLRRLSMDQRRSLKEIAEAIIYTEKIRN
ncbi:MAG: ANTAR domain-containing response regulator [Thermacetogeniaceae bacterium]